MIENIPELNLKKKGIFIDFYQLAYAKRMTYTYNDIIRYSLQQCSLLFITHSVYTSLNCWY